MADFDTFKITDGGIAVENKAQGGEQLKFTKFMLGDGNYSGDVRELTALVNPIMAVGIKRLVVDNESITKNVLVGFNLDTADVQTGFYLREIGLYAEDPDTHEEVLVFYGNSGNTADYINPAGSTTIAEKIVDLKINISDVDEITAVIDSSLVYALKTELEDTDDAVATLKDRLDNIIDIIYPIGSIYTSTNNVSPATFIGGTWQRIKDTFLLCAGDTYAAGTTGGSVTHTLTVDELPAHNHTFTGTAHSHGLNSHTHTYDKANATSGGTKLTAAMLPAHTHTYSKSNATSGSTVLTVSQIPAHNHVITTYSDGASSQTSRRVRGTELAKNAASASGGSGSTGGGQGHTHSIGLTSTNTGSAYTNTSTQTAHTHSIATTSTNTGAAAGNTETAIAEGTISATGSGTAFNIFPTYKTVYAWERTA